MARFPKSEAEIRTLAQHIITGMSENPDFPSPPISTSDLRNLLDAFVGSSDAQVVAYAQAEQATATKRDALTALVIAMKTLIHYAVDAVQGDDAKLSAIGWGSKAEQEPLVPPGQPLVLMAKELGAGWVALDWKKPAEGDEPAFYKIERREFTDGAVWALSGTALDTEQRLEGQERGKELEYRVIAVNKAGESAPSNNVMVIM